MSSNSWLEIADSKWLIMHSFLCNVSHIPKLLATVALCRADVWQLPSSTLRKQVFCQKIIWKTITVPEYECGLITCNLQRYLWPQLDMRLEGIRFFTWILIRNSIVYNLGIIKAETEDWKIFFQWKQWTLTPVIHHRVNSHSHRIVRQDLHKFLPKWNCHLFTSSLRQ